MSAVTRHLAPRLTERCCDQEKDLCSLSSATKSINRNPQETLRPLVSDFQTLRKSSELLRASLLEGKDAFYLFLSKISRCDLEGGSFGSYFDVLGLSFQKTYPGLRIPLGVMNSHEWGKPSCSWLSRDLRSSALDLTRPFSNPGSFTRTYQTTTHPWFSSSLSVMNLLWCI